MQQPDGSFRDLAADEAGVVRRIFAAGNRDAPVFGIGEAVTVNGGRFKVLAFGGKLLVLEGVPFGEPPSIDQAEAAVAGLASQIEGR